jgi:SAM-dependent methyltransferase
MSSTDASEFDQWYADMGLGSEHDEIQRRHLGLPPELLSTSLLTWDGIAEVVEKLELLEGATLVDLACGRGGYGLEIAQRTDALLIGIDFSTEAVRLAREHAGLRRRDAEFRLGDMTATGLQDASADAVMVVDAIQFADPPSAAYAEIHRILRPGGRVVLTCWEIDSTDEEIPSRLREVDLAAGLTEAGFTSIQVVEKPSWYERELAMWSEAATLDPGDDPSLQALNEEARWVLSLPPGTRRVIGSATR